MIASGICLMALCLFLTSAYGQIIPQVASVPNPVGSGSRALGMGSAFIAIADDATAASWNPGGLTQIQQAEISLVVDWRHRVADDDFGNNPDADGTESISKSNINYLSTVWPFRILDRHMVLSLSYQHLYEFSREWHFPLDISDGGTETLADVDYWQSGKLSALGLAYAIQIIPRISVGATVNWYTSASEWSEFYRVRTTLYEDTYNQYSFEGLNFNIGVLWNPTPALSIGAVFKSPFTADIFHKKRIYEPVDVPRERTDIQCPDERPPANGETYCETYYDEELDMPMSYGLGVAYRFTEAFTLSADVYRTHWGNYVRKDLSDGRETSPITGENPGNSDVEPTIQARIGSEYSLVSRAADRVISLRCGAFYDPAPTKGNPDDYYGLTLGMGLTSGGVQTDQASGGLKKTRKKFAFDMAYEYRWGDDVGTSILPNYPNFSQDVQEHMIYSSLIFYF